MKSISDNKNKKWKFGDMGSITIKTGDRVFEFQFNIKELKQFNFMFSIKGQPRSGAGVRVGTFRGVGDFLT